MQTRLVPASASVQNLANITKAVRSLPPLLDTRIGGKPLNREIAGLSKAEMSAVLPSRFD
jgi:hypothetical protein